jgi:hypothetical protein
MPTDSAALSAAPARAILLWTDSHNLFAEFPGPNGLPVVIRYKLTTEGLSSALGLIRTHAYDHAVPLTHHSNLTPTPGPGTPAQRENARAILRRLRMIG